MTASVMKLMCVLFVVSLVKCQTNGTDRDAEAPMQDYDYYSDFNVENTKNISFYTDSEEKSVNLTYEDDDVLSLDNYSAVSNLTINADEVPKNETDILNTAGNIKDETNMRIIQQEIVLDYEKIQVVQSPGYPNGYPNNEQWTWNITAGIGYGLEINVTDVDLNMLDSDYLIIQPGVGDRNEDNLLFSGYLKEPKRYRILDYDSMIIQFVSSNKPHTEPHRGFNVSVKHIGVMTVLEPTTVDPTPEWILTPVENHTIYLSGMAPITFLTVSESFRMILVDMVYDYIDLNNVTLDTNMTIDSNITVEDRVKLEVVRACNINWPRTDICIVVTYSVPLYFNATSGEYQMTRENMTLMWNSFAENDYYSGMLHDIGLAVYHMPNDNAVLTWWMAASLGVILALLVMTYLFWKLNCFDEYSSMSRMSESETRISKKMSDSSLYPTPHQTIPPLFGMESYDNEWMDQTMPPGYDYNPGTQTENKSPSTGNIGYDNKSFVNDENLFFDFDSDEEIVMSLPDNLSNKGSNIPRESTF